MPDACEPFDQPARLRAVAALTGCDREPDRQAESIDRRVDLRRQTALGAANSGSLKPPF